MGHEGREADRLTERSGVDRVAILKSIFDLLSPISYLRLNDGYDVGNRGKGMEQEINWLEPWRAVEASEGASHEAELKREVREDHPLYGMEVEAIGKRDDQGDVLFGLVDSPHVAVVHLTWRGEQEKDPRWPFAVIFESLEDWIEKEMKPDHEGGEAVV